MTTEGISATFGTGCFWGTERYFKKMFGLPQVRDFPSRRIFSYSVGFMNGALRDSQGQIPVKTPDYRGVCTGTTGMAEVLQVKYNPQKLPYDVLIYYFFTMHNPTMVNRQYNDVGTQYRSAIFYHSEEQKKIASRIIHEINTGERVPGETPDLVDPVRLRKAFENAFGIGARVATTVEPATKFCVAEDYHQKYLEQNPDGYCNHKVYWEGPKELFHTVIAD